MPMPSRRRSALTHSSVDTSTPPGTDGPAGVAPSAPWVLPSPDVRAFLSPRPCGGDPETLEIRDVCA